MNLILWIYIINATLLMVHEIESAYEHEWKLLKLPFSLTGFLVLHIPIIMFLFYGIIELYLHTLVGKYIGIISGLCGIIPFIVHKIFIKYDNHFNKPISNIIIYMNLITGIGLIFLIFTNQ